MSDTLTLKQRKFVKEYVRTGNGTQSVLNAGYNIKERRTAARHAVELLKSPGILKAIDKILDDAGLTDEKLADDLKDIIDKAKDSDKVTVSDALRGIEMTYKLKDRFPAERKQIETKSISMSLKGNSVQELTQQLADLLEQSKQYSNLLPEGDTE